MPNLNWNIRPRKAKVAKVAKKQALTVFIGGGLQPNGVRVGYVLLRNTPEGPKLVQSSQIATALPASAKQAAVNAEPGDLYVAFATRYLATIVPPYDRVMWNVKVVTQERKFAPVRAEGTLAAIYRAVPFPVWQGSAILNNRDPRFFGADSHKPVPIALESARRLLRGG